MPEVAAKETSEKPVPMKWKAFLETQPPESGVEVGDAVIMDGNTLWLVTNSIQLHCESPECNGTHWFDHVDGNVYPKVKEWKSGIAVYRCRHCRSATKAFGFYVRLDDNRQTVVAYKIGEYPPFGPPTPSRVISLIGPDRELFLKGRRAENRGLGIGAFAYYRRVVENQKSRIIEEMGRVAQKLGAKPEVMSKFDAAQKETQFSAAIDRVKDAIPESLLISGHNPLTLLHTALSQGLHAKDDNVCLELAQSIRVVLMDLAERISLALKEQAELTGAVSRILQQNSKKD